MPSANIPAGEPQPELPAQVGPEKVDPLAANPDPDPGVLIITADPAQRRRAMQVLSCAGLAATSADSVAAHRDGLVAGEYAVVLVSDSDHQREGGLELVRELARMTAGRTGAIVLSARQELDAAVDAMRSGAIDFVAWPCDPDDLVIRVRAGLVRINQAREQEQRVEQLKSVCRRLNSAHQEVSDQVGELCNDLAEAYEDLAEQMTTTTLASEFTAIVQQELDVEALLRTTLEYVLAKTGPTNAAVFLPTGDHDYNLGAYVNYDVPKDAADVLLDHLADVIAPCFEDERRLCRFADPRQLRKRFGDETSWLEASDVVVFACHEDDECIAVIMLFRDRSTPFTSELLTQIEVIRDVFANQLAKVVRIHHRHIPQDHWPGFDVDNGSGGMAA